MTSQPALQPAQVLVVGSGPAGLVAALSLLKHGICVRIIEKDTSHHIGQRGTGVQPRTLELEHFMGVDEVREIGHSSQIKYNTMDPTDPYRIARQHEFIEHVDPTPSMPISRGVMIAQFTHQAILRKHIETFGVSVELGTELVQLEERDDRMFVTLKTATGATETTSFEYLIGADGARSFVRKSLGIEFPGQTERDLSLYLVDAFVEGFDLPGFTAFGDRSADMVLFRKTATPSLYQIVIGNKESNFDRLLPVAENDNQQRLEEEIARICKRTDIRLTGIQWQNLWRANIRMATTFQKGRAFIVGDAAHTHSPTGGQGMNTSIQDSYNLAWKMALVLKGVSKPALLDTYATERMPVIAQMLNLTTDIYKKTVNSRVSEILGDEKAGPKNAGLTRGRELFQLDLNYRWSDIVFDERFEGEREETNAYGVEGQAVRAGDRAPDAPSLECLFVRDGLKEASRLFDLFNATQHVALVFEGGSPSSSVSMLTAISTFPKGSLLKVLILPAAATYEPSLSTEADYVFRDIEGHAHQGYGIDGAAAVIVRPDGHVGAFAASATGINRYTSLIFSED